MVRNCEYSAGDSGDDTDMSVCGEKVDITLPVDDLKGASSAMAIANCVKAAKFQADFDVGIPSRSHLRPTPRLFER